MQDKKLAAAIARREEQAICDAIEQYSRLLWSVVTSVLHNVGSEQDAEECVADTFIYLWEHPDMFDPRRGKLRSWLVIVARSNAIDRYRQLSRRQTVPLEDVMLTHSAGLSDGLARKEQKQKLRKAIHSLPEPDREILLRRYFYDQKPKQIALAMGMTVRQVDNFLYRTKKKLRLILKDT